MFEDFMKGLKIALEYGLISNDEAVKAVKNWISKTLDDHSPSPH